MANVPFHEEVVRFTQMLVDEANRLIGDDRYAIACEHEHSCCVLIADKRKFLVNGEWYTWINYDKFIDLATARTGSLPFFLHYINSLN